MGSHISLHSFLFLTTVVYQVITGGVQFLYKNIFVFFSSLKDTWLVYFPNSTSKIFNSPCTKINDIEFMDEIQYASENSDFEFSYEIQENYDVDHACQDAVQTLLNLDYCSDIFENCFDFSQKSENCDNFKAISSYQWEFWNFMNISKSSLTMGEASQKIIEICNTNTMPNRFGETDCFEVTYIFNILTNAYGFQVRKFENYSTCIVSIFIPLQQLKVS